MTLRDVIVEALDAHEWQDTYLSGVMDCSCGASFQTHAGYGFNDHVSDAVVVAALPNRDALVQVVLSQGGHGCTMCVNNSRCAYCVDDAQRIVDAVLASFTGDSAAAV